MSYNPNANYDVNPIQIIKIIKQLSPEQGVSFLKSVNDYNEMTTERQYAGDGINGGLHNIRVDIFVDPRRPVIHVEVAAIDSGLFFRCEQGGDIVIQELAL